MRRLAIPLSLLGSLVSDPAEAARVVDVRVGAHAEKTRIVIELDQPSGYRIGQQEIPTATGNVTELRVEMEAEGSFALAGQPGLVDSVRIKQLGEGSVALIRLKTATPTISDMALENPHRIVIDVARGSGPSPAAGAAPTTRAPAPEPPAERPPNVIVGTAPRAGQLGGPPSSVTAQPVEPEKPATEPPVATGPATGIEPSTPPATTPPPAEPAPPAAAEPGAAPTPPSAGEPAPPAAAGSETPAGAEPPAAAPITPPPPRTTLDPTPLPPDDGRAADWDELLQMLRSDPRVIGGAAVVGVLFVLWLLVRRRSRAARRRRVEPFPPLPPLDGLAPTVDEHDLIGPVREEPAPPPSVAAEEDGLPAPKRATRAPWPGGGTAPQSEIRAAAPPLAPTPAHAPPPPVWNELPPPGEPDQAELWAESDLEPDAPVEAESPPDLTEPPGDLDLPPPAPAPSASVELERELRELERRLRHLETRLEEAAEVRERMERQLAANAEELRVQRSAIARTQRVVRSLAQPDSGTKEPVRGPGS